MVLVKTLSKNLTIAINVILEINLVKRTLNWPNMIKEKRKASESEENIYATKTKT